MSMNFSRYLDPSQFARELGALHAYRGAYVGDGLLESLESARLVIPRIRIRYPAPIARRLWLESHDGRELSHSVEPDGERRDSAIDLINGIFRWQNYSAYGLSAHPLDEPDPRFAEFIQHPGTLAFEPWQDMRTDVSNNLEPVLYDSQGVVTYYSSWQLLLAVEVADAGVHFRIDLANRDTAGAAREALRDGKIPADAYTLYLLPVHAARGFVKHEPALDAVVWFAEECHRALSDLLKDHRGGRFRLSEEQNANYGLVCTGAADAAVRRYHVVENDLISLCKFLSERWEEWHGEGRPLLADAYKAFLAQAVGMTTRTCKLTFQEVSERIGHPGGWHELILDRVWPNWSEQEKKRVRSTLKSSIASQNIDSVDDSSIDAFVDFLAQNGLEAFFWRLKSFEDHAFRGNEFALEGMKSDLQGMALAVEHVALALGATETQLYEKFKQLWCDPDVLTLLKRGDVSILARQARLLHDWPALKAKIEALRNEKGGKVAADLVMAHRIRGGVHTMLPEDDQFELESLFVTLMRAAVLTFVEVWKTRALQPPQTPTASGSVGASTLS
jgi:hypothetical protein